MFLQILALPRNLKRVVAATTDVLGISFALWFAVSNKMLTLHISNSGYCILRRAVVVCGSEFLFYRFGLYRLPTCIMDWLSARRSMRVKQLRAAIDDPCGDNRPARASVGSLSP